MEKNFIIKVRNQGPECQALRRRSIYIIAPKIYFWKQNSPNSIAIGLQYKNTLYIPTF